MKNEEKNLQTGTETAITYDTLLAVVYIVAIWLMWFASIGLLSELLNGEYYLLRTFIIWPFTIVSFNVSKIVWKHYS